MKLLKKIIKSILIYFYLKKIEKHSALLNKHPKSNEIIIKLHSCTLHDNY
jgi:hypothetical protein